MRIRLILISSIITCLGLGCSQIEQQELHHGSYEAMQLFGAQRAYPEVQIPAAGFVEAHTYVQQKMESVSQSRDIDPWESLGPHNIAGRTLAIALNPQNPSTIWAGSASGGFWRSYNRGLGVSWERVELGHPALSISTIAFAPADSTTIYIGTGEVYNAIEAGVGAAYRNFRGFYGMGILKSTDGGVTWEKSLDWSYHQERGVWKVEVAPTNPNIVYAATTEGTYKSIDAGLNWEKVHNIPMAMDLVIHPQNFKVVYIGCGNFGSTGKGIYRTVNGGSSWAKATAPVPSSFQGKIMLDISLQDPNIVYASIGNGFSGADGYTWLCKTENGGDSWEIVSEDDYSRWQGWFSHDVAIDPVDPDEATLIGITIHKTDPTADTLRRITIGGVAFGLPGIGVPDGPPNFTHSDHHDILHDPTDPNIVYVANDGGVYISFDRGETWQSANGGYQTVQFYNGFSVAQDISDFAIGGLQDNSTIIYTGDLAWRRVIGGDGGWSAINPENFLNHFGSSQYLNIRRTINGGGGYQPAGVPFLEGDRTAFIGPFVISPSNPQVLYAGRAFLYKSINNGDMEWETMNQEKVLNGDPIFSMEVAPSNENVLYVGTAPFFERPELFITRNGGSTFQEITGNLPNRYFIDLTVDPNRESTVFVTLGGFGTGHVYMSKDYGETWEDISIGLPDVPTSAVIVDPENSDHIYIGNDLGVFFSPDQGTNWQTFNDGIIDAAMVLDLKIQASDRKLYVATHGNGSYRRDLVDPTSTSVARNENKIDMRIQPNPFINEMSIILPSQMEYQGNWQLIDVNGTIHKSGMISNGEQILEIRDLENLSAGNYFLQVIANGKYGTQLVTKVNE